MPLNVTISLNPNSRWDQFTVHILDSAASHGRTLQNVALLLNPIAAQINHELVQRNRGLAAGAFTLAVGQQRLIFRMPLPADPPCNCVLFHVDLARQEKSRQMQERFHRDDKGQPPPPAGGLQKVR